MAYATGNPKSKKALRVMVESGAKPHAYDPSGMWGVTDGLGVIEGPHYPQPHRWHAQVEVRDGIITRVIS